MALVISLLAVYYTVVATTMMPVVRGAASIDGCAWKRRQSKQSI